MHWAWIVLGTCFVDLFVNYSVRLGYGVVLPEMIQNLGLDRTAGGSIYNAYLIAYVSVTPLTGHLTDRLGGRRVITVCCLILAAGVLLMGTASTLWMLCFSYAVVGLGATGMWTPVITVVQRWFTFHRRGLALGILSTGYGLGFATMGAVFPWIVRHFDWRFAWYFLGFLALAMVVLNGVLLRSDPEDAGCRPWGDDGFRQSWSGTARTTKKVVSLATIMRDKKFWLIGFSYAAIAYSLYGITTFMVDYARYQLELPLEQASSLATIHGIGQIAGVLTVLPLSDYLGRKKTIVISNACITAALAGILFTGHSWGMLCLLVGCVAVFYGATFPIYGACAGDYFPREAMGTVIGAWTPFYGTGAIATHWVTGLARDATGVYDHVFLVNAVMAALGLVLIIPVMASPTGSTGSSAGSTHEM